jgi:predicted xylose isomerase-like sugar epimerase
MKRTFLSDVELRNRLQWEVANSMRARPGQPEQTTGRILSLNALQNMETFDPYVN